MNITMLPSERLYILFFFKKKTSLVKFFIKNLTKSLIFKRTEKLQYSHILFTVLPIINIFTMLTNLPICFIAVSQNT